MEIVECNNELFVYIYSQTSARLRFDKVCSHHCHKNPPNNASEFQGEETSAKFAFLVVPLIRSRRFFVELVGFVTKRFACFEAKCMCISANQNVCMHAWTGKLLALPYNNFAGHFSFVNQYLYWHLCFGKITETKYQLTIFVVKYIVLWFTN